MTKANWKNTELLPEAEAARRRRMRPAASLLLLAIILLIASFLTWAGFAEIDSVTRAEGRVVPSKKVQVIQNLEGGILLDLNVHEGDAVKHGQALLRIDSTIADARYQKSRAEYFQLLGEIARLRAESRGKKPVFPEELMNEAPEVAKNEMELFLNRKKELTNDLSILNRKVFQKRQELAELGAKAKGLERSLSFIKEDLDLNRPLLKTGAVAHTEILRLERSFSETESELRVTGLAIPRVQSALKETISRVKARKLDFKTEAFTMISEREARLVAIKEIATAEKDRVMRTEVLSPVDGIVKQIHFATTGGVIKPGDPIMEIVPAAETLLIEAWVMPQDVAFLRPGLPATVKITAYDPAIYGGLDATLEDISADTFSDGRSAGLYRIHLRTVTSVFEKDNKTLPIIPGMTASVDILTGKKTILDYLLKPILRGRERALRER